MIRVSALGLILILAGSAPARAQRDLSFSRYSTVDGLSHATVRGLAFDRDGIAWIGTSHGLTRFDGIRMTVYTSDRTRSAPLIDADGTASAIVGDAVGSVLPDREGGIWVGTTQGLSRVDPRRSIVASYPAGLGDGAVSMAQDDDGAIWIAAWTDGLFRLDPLKGIYEPIALPYTPEPGRVVVSSVTRDPSGQLWVGTYQGLYQVNPRSRRIVAHRADDDNPDALRSNRVRAVSVDESGHVWIGYERGLDRLDPVTGRATRIDADPLGQLSVNAIVASSGLVWVASDAGLHRYHPGPGTTDSFVYDPLDPSTAGRGRMLSLALGPGSSLVVGTDRSGIGVSSMANAGILHRSITTGAGRRHLGLVSAFAEDVAGSVLVAGADDVVRFDPRSGEVERIASVKELTGGVAINQMLRTRSGRLWIATEGNGAGTVDLITGAYRKVPVEGRDPLFAYALAEDLDGSVWIGTFGGLHRVGADGSMVETFVNRPDDSTTISSNWVSALRVDRQGALWVATTAGLDRLNRDSGTFDRFGFGRGVALSEVGSVTGLEIDSSENAWIATTGAGLLRIDTGTGAGTQFLERSGSIPTDHLSAIELDGRGNPWIQTSWGFFRLEPDSTQVFSYLTDVGSMPTDQALNPSIRLGDGSLVFGGTNGFYHIDPSVLAAARPRGSSVLVGVLVAGNRIPAAASWAGSVAGAARSNVTLSWDQFPVTFQYSPLEYPTSGGVRIRYRNLSEGDAWHLLPGQAELTFGSLPAGTHRIEAAFDYLDGTQTRTSVLNLRVLPVWWQTAWFVSFMLLLVGGLVVAGFRVRVRAVQLENQRLERLVDARTAELRERQVELEDRNVRLADLDLMKSRLYTDISHEFRTPLTLILGPLEDRLREGAAPLEGEALGRMHRNGVRLLRLINQMLELSRLEAGTERLNLGWHELDGFCRRLCSAFHDLAHRRGIRLEYRGAGRELPFAFDAERLEKVILNLLSNAVKFTPEGRGIFVTLRPAPNGSVSISVRDEGTGIAADHLPHLFDRYFRVATGSKQHEGSGIGLALVRELVSLHGGSISVESQIDVGSEFTVALPDLSDHMPSEARSFDDGGQPSHELHGAMSLAVEFQDSDREDTHAEPAGNADVVLVVEDNADLRAYIREQLAADYEVLSAADGAEGLRVALDAVPDLVVSDVMLPGMNGLEMLAALRSDARTSHIPVILLTAKADAESTVQGFEVGADAYVAKPFNAEVLRAQAAALIQQRRALRKRFSQSQVVLQPSDLGLPSMDTAFLERVRDAAEIRLGDPDFAVEDFADMVGMSKRQLTRKLAALLDESPAALIRRLRLARAAQLLAAKTMSVKEVSAAVGYRSESHFSQQFKEVYGESPGTYSA